MRPMHSGKLMSEIANYKYLDRAQQAAFKQQIQLSRYHRKKLIHDFRMAVGVNIRPMLNEQKIVDFMRRKVSENVDLIKTIPSTMHDTLKRKMIQQFHETPFDQQRLKGVLKDSYGVTGSRLKLITRDQTSKTIGALSEIRQTQIGIKEYKLATIVTTYGLETLTQGK